MATSLEIQSEALSRAVSGESISNYPAIFEGFLGMGIAESDIKPRENIFTFQAWRRLGRVVRKGQHGVRVETWIPYRDKKTGESKLRPKATTVFHLTQTDALADPAPAEASADE